MSQEIPKPLNKHDGYAPYPGLPTYLWELLRLEAGELRECMKDHPDNERLARVEANLRWIVGERV